MRRWLIGWFLALILVTLAGAQADERWRHGERRGFPFGSERWEGSRDWKPDRDQWRRWQEPPDRIIIDKSGKCEVRCERSGRTYRCREYRCQAHTRPRGFLSLVWYSASTHGANYDAYQEPSDQEL